MKAQQPNLIPSKKYILVFLLLMLTGLFFTSKAFSQIDYFYGRNTKGVRISAGVGLATLFTHYSSNPAQIVGVGNLDYDVNPYFSFGFEGQAGTLKGVDELHHLYNKTSTDKYLDANFNVRVALGLFNDFYPNNKLDEAIKNLYIGVGVGRIRTDNTFTHNDDLAPYAPQSTQAIVQAWAFPFNLGTNIDLRGVLGNDRVSINPNFQFNFVNSYYLDGYRTSTQYSFLKGFYNLTTIKLKYKF